MPASITWAATCVVVPPAPPELTLVLVAVFPAAPPEPTSVLVGVVPAASPESPPRLLGVVPPPPAELIWTSPADESKAGLPPHAAAPAMIPASQRRMSEWYLFLP